MTVNTVIPILMYFFIFSHLEVYNFASSASAFCNISQSEATFQNDVGFATYTVANFWRYPMGDCVIFWKCIRMIFDSFMLPSLPWWTLCWLKSMQKFSYRQREWKLQHTVSGFCALISKLTWHSINLQNSEVGNVWWQQRNKTMKNEQ